MSLTPSAINLSVAKKGPEVEANFFIGKTNTFAPVGSGGHVVEIVSGVKAGKRYKRFGIFAKARPGIVSFSEGKIPPVLRFRFDDQGRAFPQFDRATHFAFDLGVVVEHYPSRRFVIRSDAGDTMIRYSEHIFPNTGTPPIRSPAETRHNFQFSAGIGFRF